MVRINIDESPHTLGALLTRLSAKKSSDEMLPLLRLLELQPELASQMPKYKAASGIKLFRSKLDRGMPEEIQAALALVLQGPPPSSLVLPAWSIEGDSVLLPPPAYKPSPTVEVMPLAELRRIHRVWLTPSALGCSMIARPLPPSFDMDRPLPGSDRVLAPITPDRFIVVQSVSATADDAARAKPGVRPPAVERLGVHKHQLQQSIVAQKIVRRLSEDAAWLSANGGHGTVSTLRLGEKTLEGLLSTSSTSETIQSWESAVTAIVEALRSLQQEDSATIASKISTLVDFTGGASLTESQRLASRLAQQLGCEPRLSVDMLARVLMSEKGESELQTLYPLATAEEVSGVIDDAISLFLVISRVGYTSRALALAERLLSILRVLEHGSAMATPEQAQGAMAQGADAANVLTGQLAQMLCCRRAHIAPSSQPTEPGDGGALSLDPRILVFEVARDIILRPAQVELVSKLASGRGSICHQMLMGEGKTTVVAPLLTQLLADGTQLVMQIVPAALQSFSLSVLRSCFGTGYLIDLKFVGSFSFDRRSVVTEGMLYQARACVDERAVVISTPTSIKAFTLKLLELVHLLDTGKAPRNRRTIGSRVRQMLGLQRRLSMPRGTLEKSSLLAQAERAVQLLRIWRGAVAVIDEVDVVLHPLRSELNWPLGDRHALDFAPLRWELPAYLIDAVLSFMVPPISKAHSRASAQQAISTGSVELAQLQALGEALAKGVRLNLLQREPHLVLLSLPYYHSTLKPLLARLLLSWMRRQGLVDVTDEQALKCLDVGASDKAVQLALADKHVKLLNLGALLESHFRIAARPPAHDPISYCR